MVDVDIDAIVAEINKRKPTRVLIQTPEGLKGQLSEILSELKKRCQAELLATVDPCFGACDLADEKALRLGAQLLVHLGHTPIYEGKVETVYFPLAQSIDLREISNKLVLLLNQEAVEKVGLTATVQFAGNLTKLAEELEKNGFDVFMGQGGARVPEVGQVLGCNYAAAHAVEKDVDAFIFLGDGLFHPIGLNFATKKRVFLADPFTREVKELKEDKDLFLRQRFGLITQCGNASSFGILVSTKLGQLAVEKAMQMKKLIEAKGKSAFIFVADYLYPEYFTGLKVDCFVNTACPRLAIDDHKQFNKLLINPTELEIALNFKKLSDYKVDELE
jgi:2-(3-amino-3-carboxypropyl)histidine synthase